MQRNLTTQVVSFKSYSKRPSSSDIRKGIELCRRTFQSCKILPCGLLQAPSKSFHKREYPKLHQLHVVIFHSQFIPPIPPKENIYVELQSFLLNVEVNSVYCFWLTSDNIRPRFHEKIKELVGGAQVLVKQSIPDSFSHLPWAQVHGTDMKTRGQDIPITPPHICMFQCFS